MVYALRRDFKEAFKEVKMWVDVNTNTADSTRGCPNWENYVPFTAEQMAYGIPSFGSPTDLSADEFARLSWNIMPGNPMSGVSLNPRGQAIDMVNRQATRHGAR